jgi:hypothetical protein
MAHTYRFHGSESDNRKATRSEKKRSKKRSRKISIEDILAEEIEDEDDYLKNVDQVLESLCSIDDVLE